MEIKKSKGRDEDIVLVLFEMYYSDDELNDFVRGFVDEISLLLQLDIEDVYFIFYYVVLNLEKIVVFLKDSLEVLFDNFVNRLIVVCNVVNWVIF